MARRRTYALGGGGLALLVAGGLLARVALMWELNAYNGLTIAAAAVGGIVGIAGWKSRTALTISAVVILLAAVPAAIGGSALLFAPSVGLIVIAAILPVGGSSRPKAESLHTP